MAFDASEQRAFIKEAVKEALQDEIKTFYIEREQHYQDHLFIKDFRAWCQGSTTTIWSLLIKAAVGVMLALVLLGFIFWGKIYLK